MNRSSPRPSSLKAVISPSTETASVLRDSSRRLPPISAFFSTTECSASSVGPTWATVTGPVPVAAKASRRTGRLRSGSSAIGSPKTGCGVTVRTPSLKTTSNFISSGMARPSPVPMRCCPFPAAATVVTADPPSAGTGTGGTAPWPFRATNWSVPVEVTA